MALWGADAEELMPEGWVGGGDGVAAAGVIMGFCHSQRGLEMCMLEWSISVGDWRVRV